VLAKLMKQEKPGANQSGRTPFEKDQYFYHPDHIGSSNYVTDTNGNLYEHLEYFPSGETWVEESSNTQRTPYLFTSKELDEETGLYYYGARYYDPRVGLFASPDPVKTTAPALRLPIEPVTDDGRPHLWELDARETSAQQLGFTSAHSTPSRQIDSGLTQPELLSVYAYARHNPLVYHDPSGLEAKKITEVKINITRIPTKFYDISAKTLGGAASRLVARNWAGLTRSSPPGIKYENVAGGGRRAIITVKVTVTLPRWVLPKGASPSQAQRDEWDRASSALAEHEEKHVALRQEAFGDALKQRIVGATEGRGVTTIVNRATAALSEADKKLEKETDYGRKEGTMIDLR
jgi:RHS repeat-associated protein